MQRRAADPTRCASAQCLVLALGCLAFGCGARPAARNLILISIDTLRADRLGCYGYTRPTTPFLDQEAQRGVLCADVTAPSSWTYPSHAALFTGLYPGHNGATELKRRLRKDVSSLAEWLVQRGYRAAGVVSSTLFQGYGLERGFEKLEYVDPGGPEPSKVTEHARAWLEEVDRTRPFFFLIHYIDPHSDYSSEPEFEAPFVTPYEGPATGKSEQLYQHIQGLIHFDAADARHLSDLYDAGVRQQDEELKKLFACLEERGFLRDTLVVLTSDHGEEFLEHGEVMHGLAQYEESVRVPLLFFGPGLPAGARVASGASLVDVLPTCLDVLGIAPPPGLDGVSLRPLWERSAENPAPRALFIEADLDPPGPAARSMVPGHEAAVRQGNFKLVLDRASKKARLFDLATDPRELEDVSAAHADVVRALLAELERHLAAEQSSPAEALNAADLHKLQDLGYAGDEKK